MALTWREVTAPKLDTRDLAYAGQAIGASFDKLGDMFIKRELDARTKATDDEVASLMTLGTPEEIAARLKMAQAGGLNPRVNMRALMEAGRAYEGQRVQADMVNQQRLDILDRVNQSGDVAKYYGILGDEKATAEQIAEARAGILDARNAGSIVEAGTGIWDQTRGRVMTGQRDAVDANYKAGSLANDRARIDIQRQEAAGNAALRSIQIAEARARQQNAQAAERMAPRVQAYVSEFQKSGVPAADAVIALKKTGEWAKLDPAEQSALETGVSTVLEQKRALSADARTLNGLDTLDTLVGRQVQRTQAERETALREFKAQNPAYYVASRMAEIEKVPTEAEIEAAYKAKVPFGFRDDFMDRVRNGVLDPRAAMVAVKDFTGDGPIGMGYNRLTTMAELGTQEFAQYGPERGNQKMAEFSDPLDRYMAELERTKQRGALDVGDGRSPKQSLLLLQQQILADIKRKEARKKP